MRLKTAGFGLAMLAIGYLGGTGTLTGFSLDRGVTAQGTDTPLSEDSEAKVRAAHDSLKTAMDALQQDGLYAGLSDSPNSYLVLAGGGNALDDLQSGQGVDPETFAALYAGQVKQEILDSLTRDEQGRLLYNEQLIRLYSRSRLEKVLANRTKYSLAKDSTPFGDVK